MKQEIYLNKGKRLFYGKVQWQKNSVNNTFDAHIEATTEEKALILLLEAWKFEFPSVSEATKRISSTAPVYVYRP